MKRVSSLSVVLLVTAVIFTAYCGANGEKKSEKKVSKKGATVSIDSVEARAGDSLDVPISLENEEAIAGMQLKIQFDPKMVTVHKPRATERSTEMLVMHNVKDSVLVLMMYNMSGKSIGPGSGPILMLPVKAFEDTTGSSNLDLKEVILAKQNAQTVPASSRSGKVTIKADEKGGGKTDNSRNR